MAETIYSCDKCDKWSTQQETCCNELMDSYSNDTVVNILNQYQEKIQTLKQANYMVTYDDLVTWIDNNGMNIPSVNIIDDLLDYIDSNYDSNIDFWTNIELNYDKFMK